VCSKEKTFAEIFRVLKPGGYLSFADMIKLEGDSEASCCSTESWADCVAGTLLIDEIIQMITNAGFSDTKLLNTNHYKTSATTVGATFVARKQ
ncbi:MAG: class I SAM-dependent methyltransferase, partial [Gammaproteobacteria bacterium]|nr:class I SAM-dependent methyltransferase [Gammaproteobacteria bacterium]